MVCESHGLQVPHSQEGLEVDFVLVSCGVTPRLTREAIHLNATVSKMCRVLLKLCADRQLVVLFQKSIMIAQSPSMCNVLASLFTS